MTTAADASASRVQKDQVDVKSTAYAEGKVIDFELPESIDQQLLETFDYEGPKQRVRYQTEEFSAVCPFSGLPDFGLLDIKYVPKDRVVELKSLKYYLISFRNVGIFQEDATAKIYEDLWQLLDPNDLKVKTVYRTRGGIDTTCVVRSKDQIS